MSIEQAKRIKMLEAVIYASKKQIESFTRELQCTLKNGPVLDPGNKVHKRNTLYKSMIEAYDAILKKKEGKDNDH